MNQSKITFSAKVFKIGINPYVLLPASVLKELFKQAGRNKGPIPVCGEIEGNSFIQNLVKFQGKWRLYLNTPMRKSAGIDVGDIAHFSITYDPEKRTLTPHPGLIAALNHNPDAKVIFDTLTPSLQKEIVRYISQLKTEASVERNINKAIGFLLGRERFIGRDGIIN